MLKSKTVFWQVPGPIATSGQTQDYTECEFLKCHPFIVSTRIPGTKFVTPWNWGPACGVWAPQSGSKETPRHLTFPVNCSPWKLVSQPPLKRVAWMVTLKGSLTKQCSPQRRRGHRVYRLICFPLIPLKKRDLQDAGKQITTSRARYSHFIHNCVISMPRYYLHYHHPVRSLLFCPLSRKENICSLCELCVSSEAPIAGQAGRWKTFSHLPAKQSWDHPAMREGLRG